MQMIRAIACERIPANSANFSGRGPWLTALNSLLGRKGPLARSSHPGPSKCCSPRMELNAPQRQIAAQ
jgi:hypothetical protein